MSPEGTPEPTPSWQAPPRLHLAADRLALSPKARAALAVFAQAEMDVDFRRWLHANDDDERPGVVSYLLLAALLRQGAPPGEEVDLDGTVRSLANWGLIEVVGERPADPRVSGSAALRITPHGRSAVGLGPAPQGKPTTPSAEPLPWLVLHGEPRESLLMKAAEWASWAALDPIVAQPGQVDIDWLAGQVASHHAVEQAAVVDATLLSAAEVMSLDKLLRRTSKAHLPRIVLTTDPGPFRAAGLRGDAVLRWVGIAEGTRPETGIDERLTHMLLSEGGSARSRADACGVRGSGVARAIHRRVEWGDLVVPVRTRRQLQLVRLHADSRLGGPSGRLGYRLLLAGLPGTGKTMAASALATATGRVLLKLDLSLVLSRWLGETEKHLGEVFDRAEASDAVLLLDEAESLLRQREGGGDRSSGLVTTVAYLLSRIDDYRGLLVATTNRITDFDEAFFRRFDDYVVLPMPDAEARVRLWRRFLGPHADGIDLEGVAGDHTLTGGLIEGAATRAVAWAEGLNAPLDDTILLSSVLCELEKAQQGGSYLLSGRQGPEIEAFLQRQDF